SDKKWWHRHNGVPDFRGGLKVSYDGSMYPDVVCVQASRKGALGYDPELGRMCHGANSGYAAVHLAAQLGGNPIVLIGFDMRTVNGQEHYFGKHPPSIRMVPNFQAWARNYQRLRDDLRPHGVEVWNATPGSGIKCFPFVSLDDVLGRRAA